MKYKLLFFMCVLIFGCNPEIPDTGTNNNRSNVRSGNPSTLPSISTSSVQGGVYNLETCGSEEFENIQTFAFSRVGKGEITSDFQHTFRFGDNNIIELEMIPTSSQMPFISTYQATSGEWSKVLLLDKNCKPFYRYSLDLKMIGETIEGNSGQVQMQLIIKNGDVISIKLDTTEFYKSKTSSK